MSVSCIIDPSVLNAATMPDLGNMGLSFFAPLCGRNRGVFVLDPPDGETYSCLHLPESWSEELPVAIRESNDINNRYVSGELSNEQALDLLNLMTEAVYNSSANVDATPYGCDAGGLAKLECAETASGATDTKIRSVTLQGLYTPFLGATSEDPTSVYTEQDFEDMKTLGLNTIQLPMYLETLASEDSQAGVLSIIGMAGDAGLNTIIDFKLNQETDSDEGIVTAATFATNHSLFAIILPDPSMLPVARAASPDLTIFVVVNEGELSTLSFGDDAENTFAALDLNHASIVADVASSDSLNDRMKLFYHESKTCVTRSPLEYTACYRGIPVYVYNGFDLSIDDCANDPDTVPDYGQCGRFDETVGSGWWSRHRASFAARQLFSYEKGMGWSYTTWKLVSELADDEVGSTIEDRRQLLSLSNVAAAGLFPSLLDEFPAQDACLNPPASDFVMGDATYAPSNPPPPDCGNGWWNYDLNACEYWIPPSASPVTSAPTYEPCPICPPPEVTEVDVEKATHDGRILGAGVGLVVGFLVACVIGTMTKPKVPPGYSEIPNMA